MTSEKSDTGNASGAAPETPKSKPSDKQMNLLAIIMQNIEDQPKINVSSYLSAPSLIYSPSSIQDPQRKAHPEVIGN